MAAHDKLEALLAPVVEDLGYEYVGIEYSSNPKNRLLRLYIDQPETGIGVDDCETVSREVSAVLDVEEPISGQYTLEVSSPGIERPLFTAEHFQRFIGEVAKVQMLEPQEGRRKFKGHIVAVENDEVTLAGDGQRWQLPLAGMFKAHLAPDIDALLAESGSGSAQSTVE
ncbi:MAG: ribosome maturation factor RimP [Wenzhouxiangella sp.]|nr:MAG: ribosome maturation factor RimP [Wenzhouxiangella sp.]